MTIINLFKILNSMAIPSFDLIVTGGFTEYSNVVIFNKPSTIIFKEDAIFEKLLKLLSNPILDSDLSEAIKTVYDLKKKKKNDRESYLFILTDGLLHKQFKKKINYYINKCQNIGIKVFGIGLGVYPYNAKELFETFIYSVNPEHILKAISIIFGKSIKTENKLSLISNAKRFNNLSSIFSKCEYNNNFYYEELRKELEEIEKGNDVYDMFRNREMETYNQQEHISFNIEIGKDLEIYQKNILKSQKILMVMLWSYDLNKRGESPYVSPKYINEPSDANKGVCIKSIIQHFGVDNVIVVDYENAIKELLKKNNNNMCNYYSVWIFCGPPYPVLPPIDGQENTSNKYLVEEFI
jgi:hypothetical protein